MTHLDPDSLLPESPTTTKRAKLDAMKEKHYHDPDKWVWRDALPTTPGEWFAVLGIALAWFIILFWSVLR